MIKNKEVIWKIVKSDKIFSTMKPILKERDFNENERKNIL